MNKLRLTVLLFLIIVSVFSQEKPYVTYQVNKGETVFSVSQKFNTTTQNLLTLNPDIKDNIISENQILIIPNKKYTTEPDINKGDYVKGGILYHKVLVKENYFRLKKKYRVSKRTLRKYNAVLKTGGLIAGQIIKIPVKKGYKVDIEVKEIIAEDKTTKPYLVKASETKPVIARRYGISVEELERMNPQIKEGLKENTIIKVPNRNEIPDLAEEGIIMYQVEKKETLFSLSQKFNISQAQLLEHNPELNEGVKEGDMIKVPKAVTFTNNQVFSPSTLLNKQIKVAILLPFMGGKTIDFDKKTTNSKNLTRTLNIVTDFYLGSEIALDSLKKQGLSISAKVFDTKNSLTTTATLLKTSQFDDVDAIIGPMFLQNVKFVNKNLDNDDTSIISPVSSKDHSVFASKNMIQGAPSSSALSEKILSYIAENYNKQNLIVIKDDLKQNKLKFDKIIATLNKLDSTQKVRVLTPEKGYIKPELFKRNLLNGKNNWVVLLTKDPSITNDVVQNLGVLPEKMKATLFALQYKGNFDKAQNQHLARVNFHFPTASFIDYEDAKVKNFISSYKKRNHVAPSEYAFKGFDVTYDALIRLATHSKLNTAFSSGVSERTSSKFQYLNNSNKGFVNKGVFIVKYDGLNLKKAE